ncbi:MAG: peptidoglycan DD-metalloendopeptidase family protein [Bacteroidetes bacterium]|nr:peptidoglycan DD-metalloendopeptidase family protein [Bacteroidota bacterium]
MKTHYCLLLLFIIAINAFGQSEKSTNKLIADKFKQDYNQTAYDSLFSLFSPEMKNALPLDKTNQFFSSLMSSTGKITHMQFVKYEESYASYKTNFDRALFAVNISVDDNGKINGLFVKPFKEDNLPKPARNTTKLTLPFKGSWEVFWGGDTKEQNYHVESEAQKNAFDILVFDKSGRSFKGEGKSNEDYYAFGKEIFAPCDAEVVTAIDGIKDNVPGEMNSFNVGGNMVILKTANNEFLVFCHFRHSSLNVREGQKVKQGELLGLCGNSGHSSEPHLHFHIQNVEDMDKATGVKCYFDKLYVNDQLKTDYSPVKGDVIHQ